MLRKLFFNVWYFFNPPWDTGKSPPELMDYIENHEPGRALDLGCGTGTNVITLAKHGWEAIGIDFARKAINTARRKAKQANVDVKFLVDDVTNPEHVSGKFDLILDMGCYHSISKEDRRAYLENLHQLLEEDGTYMLYTFLRPQPSEDGSGIGESEIQELSQQLELIERTDGSERGIRPSTWLIFHNSKE